MLRFIPISVSALTVLALTSCSAPTPPPQATAPAPSVVAAKPAKPAFDAKTIAGFKAITGVVSKTQAAVTAGDFATASKEFEGFETNWKTFEDGVIKTSPDTYAAVEKSAKAIEAGLKSKEKAGTLSALTALSATLANSVK